MFMGEQLNHTNAEVIYLDFSITSMKISQRRTQFRSLQNIVWVRSWIEDVRFLGLLPFNELQCSGVLHHLKNPSFGLNILKDALKPEGAMGIMVYAKYGRSAVYHMQHLMKMINSYATSEIEMELNNAKHALEVLPNHNWFIINNFISDHKTGNIGIYDLLLHKRDVCYSLETLFQWISKGGLNFVDLDYYPQRYLIKPQYVFIRDGSILKTISRLSLSKQYHTAEIFHGKVIKHSFYSSKIQDSVANVNDDSNVMFTVGAPHGLRDAINKKNNYKSYGNQTFFRAGLSRRNILQEHTDFKKLPFGNTVPTDDIVAFGYNSNNFSNFVVDKLVSSNRGVKLKTLFSDYEKSFKSTVEKKDLSMKLNEFHNFVKDYEVFLLKKDNISPFPKTGFNNFFKISSI